MKNIIQLSPLFFILLVITSCSKPSLEQALRANDETRIREIINSGEFDPNILTDESERTLFEFVVRKFNDKDLAEKIASHPDLSMRVRDKALYSMLRDIRSENDEYIIDDPDRTISLKSFTKAFYFLMKPLPENESSLPKTDLTEESVMIYNEQDFYIFKLDGWHIVKFDKPFETETVLDVHKTPEYKDVVTSSPGKELIFYILHPAGMSPKSYVKVFADPFLDEPDSYDVTYWNDKLLFAAQYPHDYIFDGSMQFPDDLIIEYNQLTEAADFEGYLSWVENNLYNFVYSSKKEQPKKVPDQYQTFIDFDNMAPRSIERSVSGSGYDLVLFESISDYGEPWLDLKLAVYADKKLLNSIDLPVNGEYMYTPQPMVTLEAGKIKVFREGYNTADELGDVPPEGFVAEDIPKTTYYLSIAESGDLVKEQPSITGGNYGDWNMSVAINGDLITGYYDKNLASGSARSECSFLFYGNLSDSANSKLSIKTLNPSDRSETPMEAILILGNNGFSISAKFEKDCWKDDIDSDQEMLFEINEMMNYKEIQTISKEATVYWQPDEISNYSLSIGEPVIIVEELEDWVRIVFFTGNGQTEGLIGKEKTRKLF